MKKLACAIALFAILCKTHHAMPTQRKALYTTLGATPVALGAYHYYQSKKNNQFCSIKTQSALDPSKHYLIGLFFGIVPVLNARAAYGLHEDIIARLTNKKEPCPEAIDSDNEKAKTCNVCKAQEKADTAFYQGYAAGLGYFAYALRRLALRMK